MARTKYNILPATDIEVLDRLTKLQEALKVQNTEVDLSVGSGNDALKIKVNLIKIKDSEDSGLINENANLVSTFYYQFQLQNDPAHIIVRRQSPYDEVEFYTQDRTPEKKTVNFFKAAASLFPQAGNNADFGDVLGAQLSQFYRHRDELLVRMESVVGQQVTALQERQIKLDESFAAKLQKEEEKNEILREQLQLEYANKATKLEREQAKLEKKLKEIDDSSNTHARRQNYQNFKKIIAERNKDYSLTKATVQKRLPIHIAFILTIVAMFGLSTWLIISANISPPESSNETSSPLSIIAFLNAKAAITTAFAVFMTIYYIRWNDRWSEAHAREEFRLKRMDLDIDRANWLVELALEWKEARSGQSMPPELLQQLSYNLFEDIGHTPDATHPNEDLLSSLLSSKADLKVNMPVVGSVEVTKGEAKRIKKQIES